MIDITTVHTGILKLHLMEELLKVKDESVLIPIHLPIPHPQNQPPSLHHFLKRNKRNGEFPTVEFHVLDVAMLRAVGFYFDDELFA